MITKEKDCLVLSLSRQKSSKRYDFRFRLYKPWKSYLLWCRMYDDASLTDRLLIVHLRTLIFGFEFSIQEEYGYNDDDLTHLFI